MNFGELRWTPIAHDPSLAEAYEYDRHTGEKMTRYVTTIVMVNARMEKSEQDLVPIVHTSVDYLYGKRMISIRKRGSQTSHVERIDPALIDDYCRVLQEQKHFILGTGPYATPTENGAATTEAFRVGQRVQDYHMISRYGTIRVVDHRFGQVRYLVTWSDGKRGDQLYTHLELVPAP